MLRTSTENTHTHIHMHATVNPNKEKHQARLLILEGLHCKSKYPECLEAAVDFDVTLLCVSRSLRPDVPDSRLRRRRQGLGFRAVRFSV